MTFSKDLSDRFERLRRRLLDRRILPFVGAGISIPARIDRDPHFRPTVAYMKQCLVERLRQELPTLVSAPPTYDHSAALLLLRTLISSTEDEEPKNYNPPDGFPFDRLAEIVGWLWGHETVCETVQIRKFAALEPQPAHRYLAYLAREGLITEIITTNYDCCIEKAFLRSFGRRGHTEANDALQVIRNLHEYRTYGGHRYTQRPPYRPVLHLYKINGCAQEYDRDRETAPRIVLTERQLQTFRSERWAHDLFRDRCRTHALLFCGFGSEEPQVRHTALQIMEEFQEPDGTGKTPEEIAALPNAPFVAAYEQPSFTQLQVLWAFMSAHLGKYLPNAPLERLRPASLNAFSGTDAGALDPDKQPPLSHLSADLFLSCLYALGFCGLLIRYLEEPAPFCKWLAEHNVPVGRWCSYFRDVLFPPVTDSGEAALDAIFSTLRHLLQEDPEYPRAPLPLWQWLMAMVHPTQYFQDHDWYLPLGEDSLLLLTTLLLLFCLTPGQVKTLRQRVLPIPGLGLKVTTSARRSAQDNSIQPAENSTPEEHHGLTVYLVSEASTAPADLRGVPTSTRLIRRLAVPSLRSLDREARWTSVVPGPYDLKAIRVGRILTMPAGDLVRVARTPERVVSALSMLFAMDKPRRNAHLSRI